MGWIDACFLARPDMRRAWTVAAAAIGLLAFAVLLAGVFDLPHQQREASLRVEHALEVLDSASTLEAQFERAVSEGRAYVNSGFQETWTRAEAAFAKTGDDMAALRALTADNPMQQATLERVSALIDARIAVLRGIMASVANGDLDSVRERVKVRTGGVLTAQILQGIDDVRAEERRLLKLRQDAAETSTRRSVAGLVACGAIAAVSAFAALALFVGRRRERAHLAELSRTEALLRTILQTAPGHIYAKDLQGRMIAANAAVMDFRGKPWAALAGRTDRELLDDPTQGEAIMANDRQVIAEGKTLIVEETLGAEGETPRIWLSTKTPMRAADGTIVGMVGMSVDITDRKRAEERLQTFNADLESQVQARTAALAASEARQRAYFDHSPVGMIVMRARGDGNFVLEDINPAAKTAFGLPPHSAPGLTQAQLWPELVARDKQRKMQACASRRQVIAYSVEREINREKRLLDVILTPLLEDRVEASRVLICVRDVTRERALERQVLEHAEQRAEAAERERAVFHNSADGFFVVRVEDGPDGPAFIYEAASPAMETLTGLSAEDLIGCRVDECLPPALAQSVLSIYRRCHAENACVKYAETRQLPVGLRDIEGSITPVQNPATGRITRLVGAVRDATERNRMEAALRHSQKMEAIGSLAAGVAHDFNNILQAIIGSLDLVMDEEPGLPVRDLTGTALNAALRGSQLTHHLLSYARQQMLWPQTIDLATFLPDIERLLARTLGPNIFIDLTVRHTPRAKADPGELQTALLNLAINAAHAMPKGGTLRIAAWEERDAGESWVRIALTDNGTGMDAATLARAVEPFFTTKGLGGTGLGLSMVQGFAEQSGGTLHIDSAPGTGTTVTLRLPAATAPARTERAPPPRLPAASGRILVVDDSTDVLVTVGAFLEKAGFSVTRAEDGHRALALLTRDRRYDALVSDYAMPGLNGLDLIARARLLIPGLPALIITGYAALGDADAEGSTVLHKPFQRHELLAALMGVLGREAAPAGRVRAGG